MTARINSKVSSIWLGCYEHGPFGLIYRSFSGADNMIFLSVWEQAATSLVALGSKQVNTCMKTSARTYPITSSDYVHWSTFFYRVDAIMFEDMAICTHHAYVGHNYESNNCNIVYYGYCWHEKCRWQ